jgi:RNA polymerase sigma factor (sigma-70 family)
MTVADFNRGLITNAEFLMPFAFTLTNNKEDAKDLFQETLLRALVYKDKYSTGTNLKAWLYTIMRNIFINTYRKKSRTQLMFDGTGDDFFINSTKAITYNNAVTSINIKEIQTKIVELPDTFKDTYVLNFDCYKYN